MGTYIGPKPVIHSVSEMAKGDSNGLLRGPMTLQRAARQPLEARFIGRGGQGVISAAQLLAEAGVLEGRYVQAFPEFGAERSGAPISAYARLSDEKIEIHSLIHSPAVIVVVDSSLSHTKGVASGLAAQGTLICNHDGTVSELKALQGLPEGVRLFTLPASKISLKTLGKDIPNTPMLGAMVRVTGAVRMDSIQAVLARRFKGSLLEKNARALKEGYEGVAGPG